ncbi:hypothetical protein EUX98_g6629 [Antrodiella citrinella]|uniref:Uncharacterized protein n=1 Tax=Antrodiella citrinella TaxID=2447956 RepID=A0A4S4MQB1_9APHY|nr:hypothetical protein EUX98_g6629 [Antrodiella citrinella]
MTTSDTRRRNGSGPSPRDTHTTDLITQLQTHLQVHIARTSLLQARLAATLDEFDAVQVAHAHELAREQREKAGLEASVGWYARRVREVEAERDDLRDSVSLLVTKDHPYTHPDAETSSAAIAATVISTLRADLTKERTTNARVLDYAEHEILRLQAQIARRDAELQACIMHSHTRDLGEELEIQIVSDWTPAGKEKSKGKGRARIEASSLSKEEVFSVMGIMGARNKQLEVEVRRLQDRLQDAKTRTVSRSASTTPRVAPTLTPDQEQARNPHSSVLQDMQTQILRLSDVIDALQDERRAAQSMLERDRTSQIDGQGTSQRVSDDPSPQPPSSAYNNDPNDILSSEGEESMDLATPLQPTILLSPTSLRVLHPQTPLLASPTPPAAAHVDPANIPLPASPSPPPEMSPSPPPIPIPGRPVDNDDAVSDSQPVPSRPRSQAEEKMNALESELVRTRTDILQRGVTLQTLQRVVDWLPTHIHPSPSGSHGDHTVSVVREEQGDVEERLDEDDVD